MHIDNPRTVVEIGRRDPLELADAGAIRIVCLRGSIWVTRHDDPDDHVLSAGESVAAGAAGSTVVQGLDDAVIALVAVPRPRTAASLIAAAARSVGQALTRGGPAALLAPGRQG